MADQLPVPAQFAETLTEPAQISSSLTRRRFLLFSLVAGTTVGGGALLSACGSSSSTSQNVTLNAMVGTDQATTDAVKLFQKQHPTIKINASNFDQTHLSAALAAGNPPDVITTGGGPEIINYAARGLALDLSAYFQHSSLVKESDLLPVADIYRWDGHEQGKGPRYGMPHDWSADSMFWYDKTLFQQANIPLPTADAPITSQQWLDYGKQLTQLQDGKVKVYGLDLGSYWVPYAALMTMLMQKGLSLFNADYSQANFTQPEVQAIFQWIVDWGTANIGPDSPLINEPTPNNDLMNANRLGMVGFGYWFGPAVNADKGNVALAPTPLWGSKRVSACFSGTGWWITRTTKNADASWKFYEFFMGGPPAVTRATSGWGIPVLKSLLSKMPQGTPGQRDAYTVLQAELPYVQVLHFTPYVQLSGMIDIIQPALTSVMQKQLTLDNAIQTIQSKVDLLMQQGKDLIG